ncbi:hypothetical protein KUTeg_023992 [Tegillarca granosa]|uniref:Peptidase S1 domain-containing protein n=1 Tax=Tegillarca granosa TaxID=220873 RepID=A0ABQ9E183_TEGGR|nr:hypothetical protein KUTeg_023992 [Tegillarca granosa]
MIVGGRDTTINRWPWQAGVLSVNGFNCGGTLIDYDTVLTAAHCVHGRSSDLFTVVLGENDRDKWEGSEQYIKVDSYETHPEYKGNFLEGRDLALLHLSHNATHTAMVQSIPTLADETQIYTNEECFITGWGIAITGE